MHTDVTKPPAVVEDDTTTCTMCGRDSGSEDGYQPCQNCGRTEYGKRE